MQYPNSRMRVRATDTGICATHQARGSSWRSLAAGLAMLLILGAFLFASSPAMAAPSDWEPKPNDLTTSILRAVFGDWKNATDTVPLIGQAMKVLNWFALTFGMLMVSYILIAGTVMTAQSGQLLGAKWSAVWVPIRIIFGMGMLFPLSSGYSTAQHLILWLAMVGGGGASAIWEAALSSFTSADAGKVPAVVYDSSFDYQAQALSREILRSKVCTQMFNAKYGAGSLEGPVASSSAPVVTAAGRAGYIVNEVRIRWGQRTGSGADKAPDECGLITTSRFDGKDSAGTSVFGPTYKGSAATSAAAAPSSGPSRRTVHVGLVIAQMSGVQQASSSLDALADRIAADPRSVSAGEINNGVELAAAAYKNAYVAAAGSLSTTFQAEVDQFTRETGEMGWILAGASFFRLAAIQSELHKTANLFPKYTKKAAESSVAGVADGPLMEDVAAATEKVTKAGDSDASLVTKWLYDLTTRVAEIFSVDPRNSDHPLVQIKNAGDYLLVGTETAAAVVAIKFTGASMVASVVQKVPLLGGIGDTAKDAMSALLPAIYGTFIVLFGVGITMSLLLPMLPFMLSVGSVLGWLMAVFSAVVAAPVWLAGHLHPAGDGFAGKATGGYMILLETITRPIFIVFGLLGAFLLMAPVIQLMSFMFRLTVGGVQSDSVTGVISVIVFAVMYVGLVFTVVRQSLNMVFTLPESVYRWIGGQHAGYEQARDFASGATAHTESARKGIQHVGGMAAGALEANRKAKSPNAGAPGEANGKSGGDATTTRAPV